MSENYIRSNFSDIKAHENDIEHRLYDDTDIEELIKNNKIYLKGCEENNNKYILIDNSYKIDISEII